MPKWFYVPIFLILCSTSVTLEAKDLLQNYPFRVFVSSGPGAEESTEIILGNERKNNSLNRLSIISESQEAYPNPENACGPVALLNTLIWYEKYGLIEPLFTDADPSQKKRRLFAEIDRRLLEKSGQSRAEQSGTRTIDLSMALDEIVAQQSNGSLRLHTDFFRAPLQLSELLKTMPNFRSGFIFGRPKDHRTGEMLDLHSVSLIRADRAGYITVATWGEKYRGLLKMRGDQQWFIPENSDQLEIEIVGMMRLIPFEPIELVNPKPAS